MAGSLTVETSNNLIDWMLGNVPVPYVGPFVVRLMSANGTDTAPGVEISGDEYEPQEIAFGTTANKRVSNATQIVFSSLDSTNGISIVGVEVWDSGTTERRIGRSALAVGLTVPAGKTYAIPAGALILGVL